MGMTMDDPEKVKDIITWALLILCDIALTHILIFAKYND